MIVIRGRGHPAIRARHAKTLEFTRSADLGAGGTCVVAVESTVDGTPLAGAVRGELRVGDAVVGFDAIGNPGWDPSGPAVLRRSSVRRPDTVATHASISSADLPPEVVGLLADPGAQVTLTLRRLSPQPPSLVLALTASDAEREAADVVAADSPDDVTGRVLLLGRPSAELLASAPQPIEVLDRDAAHAVLAASPFASPLVFPPASPPVSNSLSDRDRAVVLRVATGELGKTIRTAQRRGRRTGAVLGRLPWVHWGDLSELPTPDGVRSVWLCLDPVPAADLDSRIAELRAEGMAVKQVARVLSAELGVSARQIYDHIVKP